VAHLYSRVMCGEGWTSCLPSCVVLLSFFLMKLHAALLRCLRKKREGAGREGEASGRRESAGTGNEATGRRELAGRDGERKWA
jgi:hypothetical protein